MTPVDRINNRNNTPDTVTLRDYVDWRCKVIEEILKATAAALEHRLEGMNEFRAEMQDQRSMFMPRLEWELNDKVVKEDIRILRESKAQLEGKASATSVYIAYAFSLVAMIMGLVASFHSFLGK
jgi:hypothetical protein